MRKLFMSIEVLTTIGSGIAINPENLVTNRASLNSTVDNIADSGMFTELHIEEVESIDRNMQVPYIRIPESVFHYIVDRIHAMRVSNETRQIISNEIRTLIERFHLSEYEEYNLQIFLDNILEVGNCLDEIYPIMANFNTNGRVSHIGFSLQRIQNYWQNIRENFQTGIHRARQKKITQWLLIGLKCAISCFSQRM